MRFTPERRIILEAVFARHDHFTADDLYLALRKKHRISRASVYRTIPLLIAAGLVSEVFRDGGQTCYEHTYGHDHHCHLRCVSCGKVVEFSEPSLSELEQRISARHGFQPAGHQLELKGICPECQKKAGQAPQPSQSRTRRTTPKA